MVHEMKYTAKHGPCTCSWAEEGSGINDLEQLHGLPGHTGMTGSQPSQASYVQYSIKAYLSSQELGEPSRLQHEVRSLQNICSVYRCTEQNSGRCQDVRCEWDTQRMLLKAFSQPVHRHDSKSRLYVDCASISENLQRESLRRVRIQRLPTLTVHRSQTICGKKYVHSQSPKNTGLDSAWSSERLQRTCVHIENFIASQNSEASQDSDILYAYFYWRVFELLPLHKAETDAVVEEERCGLLYRDENTLKIE